jgi:hypothetical protein
MSQLFKHHEYACIGSESCAKQKTIPKLFVESLRVINGDSETFDTPNKASRTAYDEKLDEKTCSDFVNLMDQITIKKRELRRDLHMREDIEPADKQLKSSSLIRQKG